MEESTSTALAVAVPVCFMVIALGLFLLKGCEADNARLTEVGKACVAGGGSWVRSSNDFQCVGAK